MIRHCGVGQRTTRNQDQVIALTKLRMKPTHTLAKPTLDSVAPDCFADATPDRHAIAVVLQAVRPIREHNELPAHRTPLPAHCSEVSRTTQSQCSRNHSPG